MQCSLSCILFAVAALVETNSALPRTERFMAPFNPVSVFWPFQLVCRTYLRQAGKLYPSFPQTAQWFFLFNTLAFSAAASAGSSGGIACVFSNARGEPWIRGCRCPFALGGVRGNMPPRRGEGVHAIVLMAGISKPCDSFVSSEVTESLSRGGLSCLIEHDRMSRGCETND
jgi:hypothetical protein